jgi:uncharacterized iron-regulated membrane protein
MATLRRCLFWLHLAAGCVAGIVVLIMSVTGVLLAYQRQILALIEHRTIDHSAQPVSMEVLLTNVRSTQNGAMPSTETIHADPTMPVEFAFGRERTVFVNPYDGKILGEGSKAARTFFNNMNTWHRWLGAQGKSVAKGRAVTGACNFAFLFLVVSGSYLWLPRKWSLQNIKSIFLFRRGLTGRARYWNWHNVIGIWSVLPLFIIVLSGLIMSYQWANNLLYQLTGTQPPAQREGPPRGRSAHAGSHEEWQTLDVLWDRGKQESPGWQNMTLRLPTQDEQAATFSFDQGEPGRPDQRSQLTLNRKTGAVARRESFSTYNLGRKLRAWARFLHTGEAGGVAGETIAALASAGGAALVLTGLTLSFKRFRSWRTRTRSKEAAPAISQLG